MGARVMRQSAVDRLLMRAARKQTVLPSRDREYLRSRILCFWQNISIEMCFIQCLPASA